MTAPTLRPYQVEALAAIQREFDAGKRATLLVLPTGCGKTVVFAERARGLASSGERTLVLAHRTELLEQASNKLQAVGIWAQIEAASSRAAVGRAEVVVASVQTLQRNRLLCWPRDYFAEIIVDEAHHAAAKSYGNVLDHFETARILGVTATPDRGDGKALGKRFESVAYRYDMRTAIREGFLSPIRAQRVRVKDLDLSAVKTHHGDFDQGELARTLSEENALHGVVSPLVELAGERKTIVFGVDVAHAHALAEVLNRHKQGSAIAVDGTAKPHERAAALDLFKKGRFQYLVNCALFTEGFDEPSVQCIALARPTQSRALYTQMLGRGTRLHPGKADCLVLDFVGNSRHRLIGPADALAGTQDEHKARVIEKLLEDGQLELEEVLAAADDELAKQRAKNKLVAVAQYHATDIDPFLGDHMPAMPSAAWAGDPVLPAQVEALTRLGHGTPPPGFTRGEATQMLEAHTARRKAGLATLKQCRALRRLGIDTKGMTFERANELCGRAAQTNWNRAAFIGEPEFGRRPA